MNNSTHRWWQEAIIYQIYPRSFKDANNDGIGDLRGIISKLDHLKNLGIEVIWLSPFYASPNIDNGYDISDYRAVHPDFGQMADFDELLAQVHAKGMKLIIDLVVNHSSDQHTWFQEARKAKDNPYRDYYIWQKPKMIDGQNCPPNDWVSFFSGSAWDFDPLTEEYYLHLFAKQQPDLNWENPALRQEIYDIMRFWLDKGVDGFRMDVIPFLSKDTSFGNYPEGQFGDLGLYANGPKIHDYLWEMNQEVLSKYDCMTIGECFGVEAHQGLLYVGEHRQELNMLYHFDHAVPREERRFLKPAPELSLSELKQIVGKWYEALRPTGWQNFYLGNHDNPRVVSRFGDTKQYHYESATMLATLLITLPGVPTIYQGDEIGMSNCDFESVAEFDDIQVKNAFETLVKQGNGKESDFLMAANRIARDHARTPFQWDDSANAGFCTSAKPWLKINPNYKQVNLALQQKEERSIYGFYQSLIAFRKQSQALIRGSYEDLLHESELVYAFVRNYQLEAILVIVNFTNQAQVVSIALDGYTCMLDNYNRFDHQIDAQKLSPFQTLVFQKKAEE
jgi:oligo-1,6-glucosidase